MIGIQERVDEKRREQNGGPRPAHTNWISEIGHPCTRYLTYNRLNWEEREQPDDVLLSIFREGKVQETAIREDLRTSGLVLMGDEEYMHNEDLQLSGKRDNKIQDPVSGDWFILELKSCSPWLWDSIHEGEGGLDDLLTHRMIYARKWPVQVMFYIHEDLRTGAKPLVSGGILLLKNKVTGRLKEIPISIDSEVLGAAFDRIAIVNEHVAAGTYPDRIPYNPDFCGRCQFKMICKPDVDYGEAAEMEDDTELVGDVQRWLDLRETVSEYNALDKKLKGRYKGRPGKRIVGGKFLVVTTEKERDGYTVKPSTTYTTKISEL